jgi:hypothetical protein
MKSLILAFLLLAACGQPITYRLTVINSSDQPLAGRFGAGGTNNSAACDNGAGNSTIVAWSAAPGARDTQSVTLLCGEPSQTGAWITVDGTTPRFFTATGPDSILRCDADGCAL